MATLVLSAAGAALGSSLGGSVLGVSMTALGRFAGASVGRALDQRLLGQGSDPVETGRIDRFRIGGAGEGRAIPQVYGRVRVPGRIIWATHFEEHVEKSGGSRGGKGAPRQPETHAYSYSVSLAIALCEGEISNVARVWADGHELSLPDLNCRVYKGTADQSPDPKLEAVEGAGLVPAYRGTAYVVIEDLQLAQFGNRVPQFNFEVVRPDLQDMHSLQHSVSGVAIIPGSGEYALATEKVFIPSGPDAWSVSNVNTPSDRPDFPTSLDQLQNELPACRAGSLIVSWFGDDLRCGSCEIRPKVEQTHTDSDTMAWAVAGVARHDAQTVPQDDGRPVYGGTPSDASVVQAIREMANRGLDVMYYPFILMDQTANNGRADPYSEGMHQPEFPWRGRITLSVAPGLPDSPDQTSQADTEISAFFGSTRASDFQIASGQTTYTGPDEWRYNRFILHQAALCAVAGNVSAFCIGSEMRGLTTLRGEAGFAAVEAFRSLAADCRAILGPDVKIGYAADWSEYFGYHPQDGSGDLFFHLDPLWSDANIDFVGIDNYMPLSDWRDGEDHADFSHGSIYNPEYLFENIEGGEGYDWFYADDSARSVQDRSTITDGAYDEAWVWRYKDIRNWWSNTHYERLGGVRQPAPTDWQPQGKPIWFTELGCASIDKGTNQPNKFLDPKSSESRLPFFSNGARDDLVQHQYLEVMYRYWSLPENNPTSEVYGAPMLDMSRAFVWAWDARPYPWFPGNDVLWSDAENYRRGHWINGRSGGRSLSSIVADICESAGLLDYDVKGLYGFVMGYGVPDVGSARSKLQPLMLAFGFDATEREGRVYFESRPGKVIASLAMSDMAASSETEGDVDVLRASDAETPNHVRLGFVLGDADHQTVAEEASLPNPAPSVVSASEIDLVMTREQGRATVERWLEESRAALDSFKFSLPLSYIDLGAGNCVELTLENDAVPVRVDRIDVQDRIYIEAVRVEPRVYRSGQTLEPVSETAVVKQVTPGSAVFLDLPLLKGDESPHSPHVAVFADPWNGGAAAYESLSDTDYRLNTTLPLRAIMGATESPLVFAPAGVLDMGDDLIVNLNSGALASVLDEEFLAGANAMAIGDGTAGNWEVFQFRDAALISPGKWALRHRLRGQKGTDAAIPQQWPPGSRVVVLDEAVTQLEVAPDTRGQQRVFRVGPLSKHYSDATFSTYTHTIAGAGLRPYRPAHLCSDTAQDDHVFSWVRRTRIDGDSWAGLDVPLGEETEAYLVRVVVAGNPVREVQTVSPEWTYTLAARTADGVATTYDIQVAQISASYGAGPVATLAVQN